MPKPLRIITPDFEAMQRRQFTVYCNDKEEQDKAERARQLQEHKVRTRNALARKSKGK